MNWWGRNAKKYLLFISGIITFIALAAFNGVIGNRADAKFLNFVDYLKTKIEISVEIWVPIFGFVSIILIALLVIFALESQFDLKVKEMQSALDISTKLNKLDESLLLLLSRLKQNQNKQIATQKLLDQFLEKSREIVPEASSAWLCLPDELDEDYLVLRHADPDVSFKMKENARFYIGEDNNSIRRGLVGTAYYNWKIQITSIDLDENTGCRVPSHNEYIIFGNDRAASHRTTIAVVVIDDNDSRLGVISFDSHRINNFESKEMQDLLKEISRRLARILVISKNG